MANRTEQLKEKCNTDYLGIKDPILIELWGNIQPWIASSPGNPLPPIAQAALRAFDARIGVLQHDAVFDVKGIMERNEKSSNRMLSASYIMLAVAVMTLIATVVSIFK